MARVLARSERGYVGVRLLVGLGVVVALVWAVPFVLLDRGDDPAPIGATAPVQPASEATGSTGKPTSRRTRSAPPTTCRRRAR